jgi:hypothetical protein
MFRSVRKSIKLAFLGMCASLLMSTNANACLMCNGGDCMAIEGFGFTQCWYVQVIDNDGVVVWGYCSAWGGCFSWPPGYCQPGTFCAIGSKSGPRAASLADIKDDSNYAVVGRSMLGRDSWALSRVAASQGLLCTQAPQLSSSPQGFGRLPTQRL